MIKKYLVAICGSRPCTGKETHSLRSYDYKIKDVPRGTNDCPDCKHGLRWVNEKSRSQSAVTKRVRPKIIKFFQMSGE